MALPRTLIDPKLIYLEPAVREYPRGRDILARFPDAELVEVASHWNIPQLADPTLAEDWLRVKRDTLVLGVKKGMQMRPNGRSADFIAPSSSNGCAMACAYCYVGRRKGYANPISVFVNVDDVTRALARHATKLGPKPEPNTIDPVDWVYDLGENGDLSVDASLSDNVRDLVGAFRTIRGAKGSFATKYVNRDLLDYDPQGRTRIRFSLMPETIARIVDVRTSPMSERIAAINDFVAAGYEVHVNFSPVIVHEGWEAEWKALFAELDAALSPAARAQLKCEVIFLTHNEGLHDLNLRWHPRAEDWLWRPDIQERKLSESGMVNLRYRTRPLFRNDMAEQGRKLFLTLATVVDALDRLDTIVPVARELAIRHVAYGAKDRHYAAVGSALIETLRVGLGPAFDRETEQAWSSAYTILSGTMLTAVRERA